VPLPQKRRRHRHPRAARHHRRCAGARHRQRRVRGQITLQSNSGTTTIAGRVEAKGGSLAPAGIDGKGGAIAIAAARLDVTGTINAGGASGGQIAIQANNLTQSGAITADGAGGKGGRSSCAPSRAWCRLRARSSRPLHAAVTAERSRLRRRGRQHLLVGGVERGRRRPRRRDHRDARQVEISAGSIDASGDTGGGLNPARRRLQARARSRIRGRSWSIA